MNHKLDLSMPYWHGVFRTIAGPHGGLIPRRMSAEHEEWYRQLPAVKKHWLARATTATGCRIQVAGQVRHLSFSVYHISCCRPFWGYEISTPEGYRKAFTGQETREQIAFELDLPADTTGITILFPYESDVEVMNCCVESESDIMPVNSIGDKWLFFGDSITQGWEAVNPADSYACRLAAAWHCDYSNLSVGGTILDNENIAFAENHQWNRAILAFGVNDAAWNVSASQFGEETEKSIALLTRRPDSRLVVISPIWWPAAEHVKKLELLLAIRQTLKDVCCRFPGVQFIDGHHLVPADTKYFADHVHPNPDGMASMADNLLKSIKISV